ncbi:MAG: NB-ARC domain-containing protein [Cyanobacteria bacterium P01_D01_bin.6]
MPRSLKVKADSIDRVKQVVKQRGYLTQRSLAESAMLSLSTVSNFLNGKTVDFATFVELCNSLSLDWEAVADLGVSATLTSSLAEASSPVGEVSTRIDWGDAPDASRFYGRSETLRQLENWICSEQCRLVAISGQGGIGKTSLTVKFITQIQDQFDFIVWRSLRNPVAIDIMLADLIECVSDQQETKPSEIIGKAIITLLGYLKKHRCLLVLDNFESILQGGDRTSSYLTSHEEYGQLLRTIGNTSHQSCLILTSREIPKGLSIQQGQKLPIRCLQLDGLNPDEGRHLLLDKSNFQGSDQEWSQIIEHYGGNPLALKIVASVVEECFGQNLSKLISLLNQELLVFDDVKDLFERQFQRLTKAEQHVMYWLAVNRNPTAINHLTSDMTRSASISDILEALKSLKRRSLIFQTSKGYTQQPAVTEYVINRLVATILEEIKTLNIQKFNTYPICKSQSEDYVREAQLLFVVKPLVEQLTQYFGSEEKLHDRLINILDMLRKEPSLMPGYCAGNILTILCQLSVPFEQLNFSRLPVWQADLRNSPFSKIDFSNADLSTSIFSETIGALFGVSFCPTGKLLAASGEDTIWMWTFPDLSPIAQFKTHSLLSFGLAFNSDGSLLAYSNCDAKTIRVWGTQDGQLKHIFQQTGRAYKIAFSPDGRLLACGGDDGIISIWNIETGELLHQLTENMGSVWSVDFSPDGRNIASGSDDNIIRLWNIANGEILHRWQDTDSIRAVIFHPHTPFLISGGYDRQIKIWHTETKELMQIFSGHASPIGSLSVSPDGQLVASGSQDQSIRIWQLETGRCIRTLLGHSSSVWDVSFSSDGTVLASVSDDHMLRIWDCNTGKSLTKKQGHSYRVWSVQFSPDSKWLASAHSDHNVRIWNLETGQCKSTLKGHKRVVLSIAINHTGEVLASSSKNIRLWDTNSTNCLATLDDHMSWVWSIAFSSSGHYLGSASSDQTVKLWDVSSGNCIKTFQGHSTIVWCVAFTKDNEMIVSASDDGQVKFWDIATGKCLNSLNAHKRGIGTLSLSPDGTLLATGSYDHTVKVWDLCSLRCLSTFSGHTHAIKSLKFSPDQTILLTGSYDHTLKLWSMETFQEITTLKGHTQQVMAVDWSKDGNFLASGSSDERIKIWDAPTRECLRMLEPSRLYEGMNINKVKGLSTAQISDLKKLGARV